MKKAEYRQGHGYALLQGLHATDFQLLSWLAQGTADDPDITPYGKEQAVRVQNALSRMHTDM